MRGLFIPDITAEMFRNGCLESIEALMAEGEIYDVDYQQPCEDCISRLIVQEEITKSIALKENPHQMYKRIQAIPSITPQQRVGKWMEYPNGYVCSECEIIRYKGRTGKYNYCPNCGAKMEVEE